MTARTDPPDRSQHDGDGDDEQLPCGRSLSDVWDLWEQEKDDPHLTDCPHCRQAVGELAALETSVRQLRERSATAEFYDARALTQRIMDVVRLELRPGRPLPLGEPEEDLWIVESAAARTVRAAAETVEGYARDPAGSASSASLNGKRRASTYVSRSTHPPRPSCRIWPNRSATAS